MRVTAKIVEPKPKGSVPAGAENGLLATRLCQPRRFTLVFPMKAASPLEAQPA